MNLQMTMSVLKNSLEKHSPELLIAGTIVGFIGTVVLASRETLKAQDILEQHRENLDAVRKVQKLLDEPEKVVDDNGNEVVIREEETKPVEVPDGWTPGKEKLIVYTKTAGALVKTYTPSIILGTLSIACLLESRAIMQRRYMALGAAFTSLNEAFNAYRKRVIEAEGEDKDREYLYGVKKEKIDVVDPETGKKTKEEIEVVDENDINDFTILFDSYTTGNPNWDEDDVFRNYFLDGIEKMNSDKLEARGFLWVGEVKHDLGITPNPQDFLVGWTYDRRNKNQPLPFVNLNRHTIWIKDDNGQRHKAVILEPNHQGVIINKLESTSQLVKGAKAIA